MLGSTHKLILMATAMMAIAAGLHAQQQAKWKCQLSLGGTYNSGNINNIGFRNSGSADRNDSTLAFNANYRLLYSEENHSATNRELGGGIKFDINQYDRWSPFFAADAIVNHFKGYDLKISAMAGIKYRIYSLPGRCDYSLSAALVGDYVNYHIADPTADTLDGIVARVSIRPKAKQRIGESTMLNHTTFWQPSVTDLSDFLVTSITKIENKLNRNLFLDIIFEYEYRSVVPPGRRHYDMFTEVALRLQF